MTEFSSAMVIGLAVVYGMICVIGIFSYPIHVDPKVEEYAEEQKLKVKPTLEQTIRTYMPGVTCLGAVGLACLVSNV